MNYYPPAKWKSPTSFWDELSVPDEQKGPHLFTWLEEQSPTPLEHDFILSTDGSGCVYGWGASALVLQKVDLLPGAETRSIVDTRVQVKATYGSTVQRRELEALLDGLHEILRIKADDLSDLDVDEGGDPGKKKNPLLLLNGADRATVLWYTDRSNLAKSLLFDEWGDPINDRYTDRDLWSRFAFMARHLCITPMWTPRNSIPAQKICDSLCDSARNALKGSKDIMADIAQQIHPIEKWNLQQEQKALF